MKFGYTYHIQQAKITIFLACLLLTLSSCSLPGNSSSPYLSPISTATPTTTYPLHLVPQPTTGPLSESDLATRIVSRMTSDEKLGQMIISEFPGPTVSSDLNHMIVVNHLSGVLIENKNGNAQTRDQLLSLNQAMQKLSHIPLFISTDYEGGYINELLQITGQRDSEATIGATGDTSVAYKAGFNAATDLTALGLNVNYMPIVDVLTNPNNPGLLMRTFSSDPAVVTNMGRAYLKGLTAGGVIGCLKHFPGLGSASVDPHKSLPYMDRSLATLQSIDFVPYQKLSAEGIVPMVMVTHILNPQLDPKLPTSLSPNVVTNLLRKQLNFKGVIISDTLWMGGISNTYDLAQAAVLAVKAGTDLLLGPRSLPELVTMLDGLRQAINKGQISQDQIDASVARIVQMKLHYKIIPHNLALQLI